MMIPTTLPEVEREAETETTVVLADPTTSVEAEIIPPLVVTSTTLSEVDEDGSGGIIPPAAVIGGAGLALAVSGVAWAVLIRARKVREEED